MRKDEFATGVKFMLEDEIHEIVSMTQGHTPNALSCRTIVTSKMTKYGDNPLKRYDITVFDTHVNICKHNNATSSRQYPLDKFNRL